MLLFEYCFSIKLIRHEYFEKFRNTSKFTWMKKKCNPRTVMPQYAFCMKSQSFMIINFCDSTCKAMN